MVAPFRRMVKPFWVQMVCVVMLILPPICITDVKKEDAKSLMSYLSRAIADDDDHDDDEYYDDDYYYDDHDDYYGAYDDDHGDMDHVDFSDYSRRRSRGRSNRRQNSYSNNRRSNNFRSRGYDYDYYDDYGKARMMMMLKRSGTLSRMGYGRRRKRRRKKVKDKIITRRAGHYLPGGAKTPGNFRTLKSCEWACNKSPLCLAGDYDQSTNMCFFHSDNICMDTTIDPHHDPHHTTASPVVLSASSQHTHFSKVACAEELTQPGVVRVYMRFDSGLPNGLLVSKKGDLQDCISRCLNAGGGIAVDTSHDGHISLSDIADRPQICFGLDYDFGSHECFLNVQQFFKDPHHGITSWCTEHHHQHIPDSDIPYVSRRGVVSYLFCPSDHD